ncbi:dynein light chain 2, cytoplasmic isoform X3 [Sesamum indicum]|uniref:Dynein light chain n=1 Tax=Sesamum indicum TaxID=4182 RepID=A0A6I9U328_SESIN|nr:dynein light chain 2, cytoplasmic isoform X3 [Sesamum indicum]
MSEDSKRGSGGALVPPLISSADDRKSSSGSSPAKKVIIKSADMKEDMQKEAVDVAVAAFEMHNVEKDVAEHIKKMFDKKYGPTWHCIVGKNFDLPSNFHFFERLALQVINFPLPRLRS